MTERNREPAAAPVVDRPAPEGAGFNLLRELGVTGGVVGLLAILKGIFTHGVVEGTVGMIKKFFSQTGEKAGGRAAERLSVMMWGIDKEDERRFNAAQERLAENDRVVLSKRLARLTPTQSGYYRLTVMQDMRHEDEGRTLDYAASVEATFRIIHMHSQMSPEEWARQCRIMNYTLQEDTTLMQRFLTWAQTDLAQSMGDETTRLEAELAQRRGNLRRHVRGFGWLFGR